MSSSDFEKYLKALVTEINGYLDSNLLTSKEELSAKLVESVRYSALAGGKRIRPFLCVAIAEAYGMARQRVLSAACAIELIHCYSLIHDDLPAMDNDDYRRGKLTNHKVYGEAVAILAGDTLLTTAFGWLAKLKAQAIEPEKIVQILERFFNAAGSQGMIGGQMLDLEGENKKITLEYLEKMHRAKTGALMTLPAEVAAIMADVSATELENLREFTTNLGLLFQIVDDILDVEGSSEKLGKKVGSDLAQGKATYPSILGLNKAKDYAKEIYDKTIKSLDNLKCNTKMLAALTDYTYHRNT
jgi:geranylgeranyl diphosphate synthase type II